MGRIFYVDAETGDDKNNGLCPEMALKSIDAANRIVFGAGDQLLFKCGQKWKGMLHPAGGGDRWNPAVVGSYGEGEKPLIDGDGAYAAVFFDGVSNWKAEGLRVSNHSSQKAVRQGICVCGKVQGITQNIEICRCEIFEVDGENRRALPEYCSMYWNGAIYVTFPGRTSEDSHLHDIIIRDNYIHDVTTSGIRINQQEDFINDIHHTHIVVRRNRIERTGSDGIIVANSISPLIDGNRCFDAGALGTLEDTQLIAGIWVCATKNALIQRNEVARTRMFENDGTAFDTDWGTAGDTIFQYNYTHDNEGGFWLDCMKLNHNRSCGSTILRYNVSMRDGRGIAVYDQGMPTEWYGNLFYYEKPMEICCFDEAENFCFTNNVFCLAKEPQRGWQKAKYVGNMYGGDLWMGLMSRENRDEAWLEEVTERLCRQVKTRGQGEAE